MADRGRDLSGFARLSRLLPYGQSDLVRVFNRILDGDDRLIHGVCRKTLGVLLHAVSSPSGLDDAEASSSTTSGSFSTVL